MLTFRESEDEPEKKPEMIRVENKSGNDNVTELEEHLEEKSVLSSVKSCKEAMVSEKSPLDFAILADH